MSIFKRTVYYGKSSGDNIRFLPYAMVDTTIGSMVEPFNVNQMHTPDQDFETYDPADEVNRVDLVERIDLRDYRSVLSYGSATPMHGGDIQPRQTGTK